MDPGPLSPGRRCGTPGRSCGRAALSERLASEASFAALCGGSPVERSSDARQYRRLNHGGDRQANAALHRIVQTRLRCDPRTQEYCERRLKGGKTRREIVRCLKRYAAREVFHLVRAMRS
ncbi:transposase [Streptomyces sp. NPDC088141]|uniref:transposase n=1 Tax=unclassified Streptomyces TaxID=2593676 RepID=UPI00343385FC